MRLSLIIVLLSVIVSAVFSAPPVPLRGTLKDVSVESSSSSSSSSTTTPAPAPKKVRESEEGKNSEDSQTPASPGSDSQDSSKGDEVVGGGASGSSTPTQAAEKEPETPESTPKEECGTSFIMWFGEGTPATTLKCGGYTIVYAPEKDNKEPAPRYISGDVKAVTFEKGEDNTVKIKVDGKEFSTPSSSSSSPTENNGSTGQVASRSRRSLSEENSETAATVDLFAFALQGGKRIEVAVPSDKDVSKRNKYSLVAGDKTFYTGANSGNTDGIYRLNDDGDLVDKNNNVLLKDAGSSALGFRYIVPSVFAIFAALFVL
uniref:60 kDa glycoprotein n=7 Tax=Cryptosporidium parvum TaxID=5807 RepID=C4P267_CRYPV|nr:60 kDa glycoprotein [Cryptosporidium parvum]